MTEAERMKEKSRQALIFLYNKVDKSIAEHVDNILSDYVAVLTSENSRLQQLIKEKDEEIKKLNKTIRQYSKDDDGKSANYGDRHGGWSV